MYVVKVPNRGSPPAILLRESYREAGTVKNRTLASLSAWPEVKAAARRPPPPSTRRSGSPAACRTATSPPCWARPAGGASKS